MLTTRIDEMVNLIRKKKKINFYEIARELSWSENSVEKIALVLEKAGLAQTHYPVDMVRRPWVAIRETEEKKKEESKKEKALEKYDIAGREGRIKGTVMIVYSEAEKRPVYNITLPEISVYTKVYLEHVKVEASKTLALEVVEKGKEESTARFERRHQVIFDIIQNDLGPEDGILEILAGIAINEMFGLGEMEALIGDERLEEVIINSTQVPISVYHRKYGWLKTNIEVKSEEDTENYAAQIARKVGRQISLLNPILDARLSSGDRANATLYPISSYGNTLTMRLFSKNPWTIISFLKKEANTMTTEMAALLWQAMQYEMNVVIAGGTASGKTSALNGLLALIQPFQRIVTIEDTRELSLPTYQWNWVPLVTRPPNPEGYGEVTMLDLVVNSLRMRPDRIIMGEIRRKQEAEVLFEAMHTGHSVYATIHADTGPQVIKRLIEPPIEVPASEVEDIHLLLVQYRDRRKNIRRTLEISEVVPGVDKPDINRIYNWKPRTDSFEMVKQPHRYTEEMNLHTGMTEKEIKADQKNKVNILQWMVKNNIDTVEDVGKIMKIYYADESVILKAANKGVPFSKVL
ncbi:type II/IV secretion system ATPase subunit [Candidatus Micrarchaeota archaeon]|nr:type II/IV secretion system ATPase subunit [Candidatus Micrarchaeota archaeon]